MKTRSKLLNLSVAASVLPWRSASSSPGRLPPRAPPSSAAAQTHAAAPDRSVDLHRRRRRAYALLTGESGQRIELPESRRSVDVQRSERRHHDSPRDARVCGRQASQCRRSAASRCLDRSHDRQNQLDIRGTGNTALQILHARRVRERYRLCRSGRQGSGVHLHAGLLPVRARCRNRQAAAQLGQADPGEGLSADRRSGSCRRTS